MSSHDVDETQRSSGADRRGFSFRRQLASLAPLGVLWFAGLAMLFVASQQSVAPLRTVFLDPAHLTGAPWYTGIMSTIGVMIWTSAVVFGGAGAWVAKRIDRRGAARFLAVGSGATLLLVLDDVFQLHAGLLRDAVGDSKNLAQLLVVAPVGLWVLVFWNDILRTRSVLLFAAVGSLGGSVVVDFGVGLSGDAALLLEDGMKFLGILAWSQYFAITSKDIAASAITSALDRESSTEPEPILSSADLPETRESVLPKAKG